MIRNKVYKYSVSVMYKVLELPRSTYYYKPEPADNEDEQRLENAVVEILKTSRNNYGTRKIKVELKKKTIHTSRRKIGHIMKKYGLVSNYNVAQYKPSKSDSNESLAKNQLQRKFQHEEPYAVVVGDLTYVRVRGSSHMLKTVTTPVEACVALSSDRGSVRAQVASADEHGIEIYR